MRETTALANLDLRGRLFYLHKFDSVESLTSAAITDVAVERP